MQLIKKIAATSILLFTALMVQAEGAGKTSSTSSVLDADTMLVVCIGLLAIVIISLANTLLFTMKYYKAKQQKPLDNNLKAVMLVACVLVGFSAMAETPDLISNTVANETGTSAFRMILYIIVGLEMIVVFLFTRLIKFFTRGEYASEVQVAKKPLININYKKLWSRLNKFKPIEEEASIDTGHSYDGIHELNNVTPPWFKVAFILSVFFAFGYMYRYQIAKTGPSPEEEYNTEMAEAKTQHEEYLKSQKSNVDENTVAMLDAAGVAAGAELFKSNCIACHGNKGQGGVGPNLTDEYWLHSGGIKDIFKSIKYGWKEKGMQSWQGNFSPEEIARLASFVKSLKGTKPVAAKDPQGELYTEAKDTSASKMPVDSASKK